ncbi:ABC transporter permease [bacterium]|nr:ABC transporter permease [bacterium]
MRKLFHSCQKEFLILSRDRAGLLILFLMPMFLVFTITLIQNNILKEENQSSFDILFLNEDQGWLGLTIEKGLIDSSFSKLQNKIDDKPITYKSLRQAIALGDHQIGIVVHEGASKYFEDKARQLILGKGISSENTKVVTLVFDPTVQQTIKLLLENSLQLLLQAEQFKLILQETSKLAQYLPEEEKASLKTPEKINLEEMRKGQVVLEYPVLGNLKRLPNAVQHNVPAWTMFGIFFIVIPLSGSIIRERDEKTLTRIFTIPVPFATFLLGKIIVYSFVNLIQLCLMLLVGLAILPLFGTPVLELGDRPDLILLVGICSALAGTAYGLMLGTVCRTYDQASVFGPISIVMAAALGGLMVPTILMPTPMRHLAVFSPLHWGYTAFIDIFVRGADLELILPNIGRLFLFFIVNLLIALVFLLKKE